MRKDLEMALYSLSIFFKTGFHFVAQASLRLTMTQFPDSPASAFQERGLQVWTTVTQLQ